MSSSDDIAPSFSKVIKTEVKTQRLHGLGGMDTRSKKSLLRLGEQRIESVHIERRGRVRSKTNYDYSNVPLSFWDKIWKVSTLTENNDQIELWDLEKVDVLIENPKSATELKKYTHGISRETHLIIHEFDRIVATSSRAKAFIIEYIEKAGKSGRKIAFSCNAPPETVDGYFSSSVMFKARRNPSGRGIVASLGIRLVSKEEYDEKLDRTRMILTLRDEYTHEECENTLRLNDSLPVHLEQ